MKIVIAGAGEVGTHLAKMLSQENQDIILMDPNEERLNFSKSSMEILPMVGNPTSLRDLEEAGIKKAVASCWCHVPKDPDFSVLLLISTKAFCFLGSSRWGDKCQADRVIIGIRAMISANGQGTRRRNSVSRVTHRVWGWIGKTAPT